MTTASEGPTKRDSSTGANYSA